MTASSGTQARDNGRKYNSYDTGMCQKFVRDPCWKVPSLYGSAIDAWNGAAEKHPGDRTPPVGAPCYYRGGQYGHAVIYAGNGKIRSTDCTSRSQVSEQSLDWPERAWGYDYLGWTGDINGVTLPLGSDTGTEGLDDVGLQDEISEWSPDEGSTGETTVGKTLNQARGYSEDTYDRVKKLQGEVDALQATVNKIAKALGV
jgi:hypothetical protein